MTNRAREECCQQRRPELENRLPGGPRHMIGKTAPIKQCWITLLTGGFLYAQAPQIDAVTPSEGPIAGGTVVVLRGSNLADAKLTLDNVAVAATVTAQEIRFTTPKHDNGYAILRAATSVGTATGRFLYIPPALKDLPPGY